MTIAKELTRFDARGLNSLFEMIKHRVIDFDTPGKGIILRTDIDNNLETMLGFARLCKKHGIKHTAFILPGSPYFCEPKMWLYLKEVEECGGEIAWHNNALTDWIWECVHNDKNKPDLLDIVERQINTFRKRGFNVTKTASHGDRLCHRLKYVNYQIWKEFQKENQFAYEQIALADVGLTHEAYQAGHDVYLSESGGLWRMPVLESDLLDPSKRIQILIHPQWWKFS